jgi:hypothetical protein
MPEILAFGRSFSEDLDMQLFLERQPMAFDLIISKNEVGLKSFFPWPRAESALHSSGPRLIT